MIVLAFVYLSIFQQLCNFVCLLVQVSIAQKTRANHYQVTSCQKDKHNLTLYLDSIVLSALNLCEIWQDDSDVNGLNSLTTTQRKPREMGVNRGSCVVIMVLVGRYSGSETNRHAKLLCMTLFAEVEVVLTFFACKCGMVIMLCLYHQHCLCWYDCFSFALYLLLLYASIAVAIARFIITIFQLYYFHHAHHLAY